MPSRLPFLKGPIVSIEDDEDDQFLLAQVVKKLGIANEVRFFTNGLVALQYFETTSEQPFLILCDINLPIMNGLELRKRINQSDYLRQKSIPFVFLTTAASPDIIREAYRESVQGFFQKASDYVSYQNQIKLIFDYWQTSLHPNRFV
ncbi:response regulator [Larkinella rosea]|uniref:Response regulator n=1 Tax=Larkinella rosea TaxID=2025312 RepID=A0A3P1BNP3_9BACT|nr:response regulator [Larkinella rosea]RRB02689.1 response regulator [Larkinella rosea]